MIRSLFGAGTAVNALRGGLEEQMATQRGIAARVQRAVQASSERGFAGELQQAGKRQQAEVDIQAEMASLADTQIRYEATAKLLSGAYQKLRTAIRNG